MDITKLEEIRARYRKNCDGAPKGNNNAAGPHNSKKENESDTEIAYKDPSFDRIEVLKNKKTAR